MFNFLHHSKPPPFHDYLPWVCPLGDGTIQQKDGSWLQIYQYSGKDLSFASDQQIESYFYQLNQALSRFGSNFSLFFEYAHQGADLSLKFSSSFDSLALSAIRDEEAVNLGEIFQGQHYLGIAYLPASSTAHKLGAWFNGHKDENDYLQAFDFFRRQTSEIIRHLSHFMEIRPLTETETLTYLHSRLSTQSFLVKAPTKPYLFDFLTDSTLIGGTQPQIYTEGLEEKEYLGVVSILRFPPQSTPLMLDALKQHCFSFRWCTRWLALGKSEALAEIERRSKAFFGQRRSLFTLAKEVFFPESISEARESGYALEMSGECEEAKEAVQADLTAYGYLTTTIIITDSDNRRLKTKIKDVIQVLNRAGFIAVQETFNAVSAWEGTLMGNTTANPRRYLLSTINLNHLLPLTDTYTGNDHDSLLKAKTKGNTLFNFGVTSDGIAPHGMIAGNSGGGKSFAFKKMVSHFLIHHPNGTVFILDKDFSVYCFCHLMNGHHYDLSDPHSQLMPLMDIDKPSELAWAYDWVLDLVKSDLSHIDVSAKKDLQQALQSLSLLPKQHRTLTGLQMLLQDNNLRSALQPYLAGSVNGLLDAEHDNFHHAQLIVCEMGGLLSDYPHLVAPTFSLLVHRHQLTLQGQAALLGIDEAPTFLAHPSFSAQIKDWLKSLRKQHCHVWLMLQSLADVTQSSIAPHLIEGIPIKLFTANSQIDNVSIAEAYRDFGLNEKEIQSIRDASPRRDYLLKTYEGSQLIDFAVPHGSATQSICGSDSKTDIQRMRAFVKTGLEHEELFRKFMEGE